jgi:hypothetical protein
MRDERRSATVTVLDATPGRRSVNGCLILYPILNPSAAMVAAAGAPSLAVGVLLSIARRRRVGLHSAPGRPASEINP